MTIYDKGGWEAHSKMTDDNDSSLRRCTDLDQTEDKKTCFAVKYLK